VLVAQGWTISGVIAEDTSAPAPLGWLGAKGDPFFCVIGAKTAANASP
jgi:hypothetical protein